MADGHLHGRLETSDGRVLFEGDLSAASLTRAGEVFSSEDAPEPDVLSAAAQGRLKSIVERIERLETDKAAVGEDIKQVYAEAKGEGFSPKIIRRVVKLKKTSPAVRAEEDALLDLYLSAIGGL